jgi:hypothetical protein
MKWVVTALVALCCGVVTATDRDTLPLKQRTSPTGDTTVVPLGKPASSEAAVPAAKGAQAGAQPYIASVDVYGSPRINEVNLKETLGPDLQVWLQKGLKGDPAAAEMEKKLAAKLKAKFDFAAADWSIIQYFEPDNMAIHVTLDVVDKKDVAKRMPFLPAPTGEFKDPDGLIKTWDEYEDLALDLVEAGQLEPESDDCVAFHCPFGHKHPQLKKYEKIFVDGVNKNAEALLRIQAQDRDPDARAAATYLLAYLKDGKKVVDAMVGRIHDPDASVRNNALRVLGDIAEFHPDLLIPDKPIIEALSFPRVSDRSKALYVLYLLTLNSAQVRDDVMKGAVPTLLSLMTCKQPDHEEISHAILRKLSGKEFPQTDIRAWTNWYKAVQRERGVATGAG